VLAVQLRLTLWVPVPDRDSLPGEFVALLTNETLPVKLPPVVGENTTFRLVFWPEDNVNGKVKLLTLKPVPVRVVWDRVTLAVPVFVIMIGREEEPIATSPQSGLVGLRLISIVTPVPVNPVTIGCSGVANSAWRNVTWTPTLCQEFNGAQGPPETSAWSLGLGGGGWGNNELEIYCGPPGYAGNPVGCPATLLLERKRQSPERIKKKVPTIIDGAHKLRMWPEPGTGRSYLCIPD